MNHLPASLLLAGLSTIAAVRSSKFPSGAILSVGYEQRTVEELVQLLTVNEVDVLVDVRLNAISRKRGFSKTALGNALSEAGIEYRHERKLGNPKENREPFRKGLASARDRYRRHLSNGASAAYRDVAMLAKSDRVALLCYERDHRQCHRSCIAEAAQNDYPELSVSEI